MKGFGFSHWTSNALQLALSLWNNAKVAQHICVKGIFSYDKVQDRLNLEIQDFPLLHKETEAFMGCCGLRPKADKGIYELRTGHHPCNTASTALLHKLGFEYIKDEYYESTGLYHPNYKLKK